MSKISRNALCPCGSGKKYKKCCLQQATQPQQLTDLTYQKLRKIEGKLIDSHLRLYVKNKLPTSFLDEAVDCFFPSELPEDIDGELMFGQIGMAWFLFDYIAETGIDVTDFDNKKTIAQNYVENYPSNLNKAEIKFIDVISKTYFSFYSVMEVSKGKGLVVKDCLLETIHDVTENKGTYNLEKGNIIFGRLLNINNRTIFVGLSPNIMPARYQVNMITLRKWLIEQMDGEPLDTLALKNKLDVDILDYYFHLLDEIYNPQIPQIRNSDGDELQFTKSYFKLSLNPETALSKLASLTLSEELTEILSDGKRDSDGKIIKLEFPWVKKDNKADKSLGNTILGDIILEKNKLILVTNSAQRDKDGQKLIKTHLKDDVHFQNTLIESVQQKIKNSPESKDCSVGQASDELLELPEVQEHLKGMAESHWENWFDYIIPALDNKTPRESSKTKEGRELLEALLLDYESHERDDINNIFKPDTLQLRNQLGLDDSDK